MTHFQPIRTRVLAATLLLLAGAEQAAAGAYSIDILIAPGHPGVVDSWLFGINASGQSTGYIVRNAGVPVVQQGIVYQGGAVLDLPTAGPPSGFTGYAGLAVNNVGDVVGNIDFAPYFMPAGGGATLIDVPDHYVNFRGGLNDSGNALISPSPLDFADLTVGDSFSLWSTGGIQALSVLDPLFPFVAPPDPNDFNSGPSSSAFSQSVTGLNNANQFAADIRFFGFDPVDPDNFDDDINTEAYVGAFIYDGQGGYHLLQLPTPGDEIAPVDIDEAGTVLGWVGGQLGLWGPDGVFQSMLPDPGVAFDPSGSFGYASAQRNNLGQVVAISEAGGVLRYDPDAAAWTEITASIAGPGIERFGSIQGLNDAGQFVGLVRPAQGGGVFGYVVTPVPESSSLLLLGVALAVGLSQRVRFNSSCRAVTSATRHLIVKSRRRP